MLHPSPTKINTARRAPDDFPAAVPASPAVPLGRTHTKSAKVEIES